MGGHSVPVPWSLKPAAPIVETSARLNRHIEGMERQSIARGRVAIMLVAGGHNAAEYWK